MPWAKEWKYTPPRGKGGGRGKKKKQQQQQKPPSKADAPVFLAQGVGTLPKKAFGGDKASTTLAVWDAKMPAHLPLPRAVGPYLPVRATRLLTTGAVANIFGSFKRPFSHGADGAGDWTDICGVSSVDHASAINANGNATFHAMPLDAISFGTSGLTLVPSAITVQIMNGQPLQDTTGIVYAGVMNTQAKIAGRTESWDAYMGRFVEFQAPRVMAAGKLALRGVQISSYPLSMSQCSEFTSLEQVGNETTTYVNPKPESTGWAPIMVLNPNAIPLSYLITVEYRVRFDLGNAASAAHKHHHIASDAAWDGLMRKAASLGHGVLDIADVISRAGSMLGKAESVRTLA